MNTPETFQTPMAECHVENGIFVLELTKDAITLEMVKAHFEAVAARPGNLLALPSITFVSNMQSLSKEARDFVSKITEESGTPCSAVVIRSTVAKVFANLFLKISKPSFPTQIFTDKEKAVEWVQKIIAPKP